MKGRGRFSRIVSLSICFILLLSLAEFQEQVPFGFHTDSGRTRVLLSESDAEPDNIQLPESVPVMIHSLLDDGSHIAIVPMFPGPSPRRSGQVDSRLSPPDEARPGSSPVQRI